MLAPSVLVVIPELSVQAADAAAAIGCRDKCLAADVETSMDAEFSVCGVDSNGTYSPETEIQAGHLSLT